MNHEHRDAVDRLLQEAGEKWRATVPEPASVDARTFADAGRARLGGGWWLSAAAAVMVLFAIGAIVARTAPPAAPPPNESPVAEASALPSATLGPTPTVRASSSPRPTPTRAQPSPTPRLADEVVHDGDLVEVEGPIIDWSTGPIVCTWDAWDLSNPPQPGCISPFEVSLAGIDPRDHGGGEWYSAFDGGRQVWVTGNLTVYGTWQNGAIEVFLTVESEGQRGPPPPWDLEPPPVPCEEPPGGWPGNPEDLAEDPSDPEALVRRLDAEVERQPDLYAGYWSAADTDEQGNDVLRTLVVGTVGDVEAVERELRAIYPANLCVVGVQYSTRELEGAAIRVRAQLPDRFVETDESVFGNVEIDASANRVVVVTPVLDESVADAIEPVRAMVEVRPIAGRVDTSTPAASNRVCGRLQQPTCDALIAVLDEARPEVLGSDTIVAVNSGCGPGWASCPLLPSYIVAVVQPGCAGGPALFGIQPRVGDALVDFEGTLPAHVADLLPPECAAAAGH